MRSTVRYVLAALLFVAVTIAGPIPGAATAFAAASAANPAFAVVSVRPSPGEVVGIGYQPTVTFAKRIANRAAAERTISVSTAKPMTGRFNWTKDDTVQWIPDGFWPAHSRVTLLAGGEPRQFDTGAGVVGVASISAHTFTVTIDGHVARTMPASMGKPTRPTPTGNFTILEKDRSVIMDSRTIGIPLNSPEGYRITASYAERITWSGVYVHSAPWSVDSQGHANVSHGCINLSPDNAAWYFNTASVGDPVIVEA